MRRIFILLILHFLLISQVFGAVCMSNEYCPSGWSVKRRADGSATTCDPMDKSRKCEKPFMCIASKCGLKFCCANDKMANKLKKESEEQEPDSDENVEL